MRTLPVWRLVNKVCVLEPRNSLLSEWRYISTEGVPNKLASRASFHLVARCAFDAIAIVLINLHQTSLLPPIPDFTSRALLRGVAKKTLHRAPSVKSHRVSKANAATSKAAPEKSHCSINAYTHDNIQNHTKGMRSRCMLAPLT
jgi:hypothetical protein